ncbi:LLM class flavin-dependent oxidoreductase [Pseudalkalibacillus hwajinpoensis]|uniref:LLM class flavin-dependent oxidoreductase n=1 Tax=Guptibacillus hwajinpoensis TaxID=208199 RepID=A0A4U1MBZ0_9BACL|nr:LLM class flavin-dependent oxidoreductase [Pseudalkalibacillus hwajinpoensis]TKD68277.1 LLM class flavin-dependent oxidoreductase [Pseudalkalibacillus hwajinpoensis]
MITLSILDQVPIPKGSNSYTALEQTRELALLAEQLGYHRYWFAEHHSTKGLASTAPEIMMAHIAASTSRIKVGSGGVLLPQYSPFKVAENFRQLEALHPNRIDLGVGRSPGGTAKTRLALTDGINKSLNEFPRQLTELSHYLTDSIPSGHDFTGIKAAPHTETPPALWLLGMGENSAEQAADLGIGYVFGHFIKPTRGKNTLNTYYERFQYTYYHPKPQAIIAIFVICGETDEHAEELARSQDLWLLRVEKGLDSRVPSVEEAKNHSYTKTELERIQNNRRRMVIGSPQTVKQQLHELSNRYQTEEFMVLTNIHSFEERKKSYERLARIYL